MALTDVRAFNVHTLDAARLVSSFDVVVSMCIGCERKNQSRQARVCLRPRPRPPAIRYLPSAPVSSTCPRPLRAAAGVDADRPGNWQGDVWQRLHLLQRQQRVAVAEENYTLAAQLRDESKVLADSLPPIQQYLQRQVSVLQRAESSLLEKLQAIKAMAEAGDPVVVPDLAACLTDQELQGPAQEAMWTLFTR
ncbi:uncharacterized protein HaLaN_20856, partial [Haematococcus lacustris]